ncbi:hypothetical protein QBC43DRAFT_123197 [Cladorrhinum sp. PSN259]|nr:hypothetical protein QBC43DRAFT_123197 [Cladorrhinum sp. PSN259]
MSQFADPDDPTLEECRTLLGCTWLKPGKQCPHPANTWFRDTRASPPPLPPPKDILEDILRNHAIFSPRHQAIIAHYKEPPSPSNSHDNNNNDDDHDAPKFHLFSLLPTELREQIWKLAIPRRTLDVREVYHRGEYMGIRSVKLPVPRIASVCREARDLVMRLGSRLALSLENRGVATNVPAGFFVKGRDVVLYLADQYPPSYLNVVGLDQNQLDGVVVAEGAQIVKLMRCEAAAVNWAGERKLLVLTGEHRNPVTQYLPGSSAQGGAGRTGWLSSWAGLKAAESKDLKTVFVFFKSRYIEVSLFIGKAFSDDDRNPASELRGGGYATEIQLLVDLYDDSRLAELSSLESLYIGERKEADRPRYAAPEARNPGLCLNCERVQWERYVKPLVVRQWLQLYEDELDEGDLAAAFAVGTDRPFDPDNHWVKEKLRDMPEFRPAILIHLQLAEEMRLREEENSEWAGYHTRVLALR